MKNILLTVLVSILFFSCTKNTETNPVTEDNATVLYRGLDCGDSYLIQLDETVQSIPENDTNNIFYEINLPEQYKVDNLRIHIHFREPHPDEIMSCTCLGDAYPQLYITCVEE